MLFSFFKLIPNGISDLVKIYNYVTSANNWKKVVKSQAFEYTRISLYLNLDKISTLEQIFSKIASLNINLLLQLLYFIFLIWIFAKFNNFLLWPVLVAKSKLIANVFFFQIYMKVLYLITKYIINYNMDCNSSSYVRC